MARNQRDSRIPVFRRGIPVPTYLPRPRATNQVPIEAAIRPTALAGLTTHWLSSDKQPSPQSSSPSSSPSESSAAPTVAISESVVNQVTSAHLDCEVLVGGTKPGILRYFGNIPFDSGLWCGVELHKPEGLNDGSVRGIRLFSCKPLHGVLAPISKVTPLVYSGKASLVSPTNLSSRIPDSLSPGAVQSTTSLVPSGVKRQRTNTYEAEATVACSATPHEPRTAIEEDEGSTPREELAGEAEERWSSEEVTPPAEQTDHPSSLLCHRVTRGQEESPTEHDKKYHETLSPSSVPTPITPRTLEWNHVKTFTSVTGKGSWGSSITSTPSQQPRSISDSSLSEMAGVVSTSTPTAPLTTRSNRRGHGVPCNNNKNTKQQTQQQRQQCNNDGSYTIQRGNEECFGCQHNGDSCACGHPLSKHSSFEMDESLGILTPDQMVDFTVCMDGYGRTPSSDDIKRFSTDDGGLGFPSDPFGRTPSNENLKRYAGKEMLMDDGGGILVDVEPSGSDQGKGPAVFPSEQAKGTEDGMEGGEEAAVELEIHSDPDEEEPRMDEEEEEVKDVLGKPCSSAVMNSAQETSDTMASITASAAPRPAQVAPCFVASVTSITSIDPGYQGDGEWSRPASRAENSPGSSAPPGIGVNVGLSVDVLKIKFDAMTDSDFYSDTGAGGTESDADHEEAVRDGSMAPGDRRAQVIDGTLYGGITGQQGQGGVCASSHQQPPPRCFAAVMTSSTATTTEEMESSGVFSDLDRRTDMKMSFHSHAVPRPSSAQGVSSSAAESSDVPQSPLEELPEDPKKDITYEIKEPGATNVAMDPDEVDTGEEVDCTVLAEEMDTSAPPEAIPEDEAMLGNEMSKPGTPDLSRMRIPSAPSPMSCEVSPNVTPTNTTPMTPPPRPSSSAGSKDRASQQQQQQQDQQAPGQGPRPKNSHINAPPPKKHKMPKRNVASKIKAMIEASSTKDESTREDGEGSSRRQSRTPSQRPGRWDAIMSKIAAGQAEQRTSRPRLREVKSKVMAGITSNTTAMNSTTNEEGGENATPASSVRTKKTFISNVTRARRAETRTRARGLDISSLRDATCSSSGAAPSGGIGDSLNPSVHSSMSDVSLDRGAGNKASVSSRSSKKREADRSASPFSDGSSNSGASNIPRPLRSNMGAVPRQPPHPQRSRDKTTNTNALPMASSTPSAAVLRRNQRNVQLTSSASSAKRVNVGCRKSQTAEKSTAPEMKNPPTRRTVTRHLASSAAQVQKPAPLRESNRLPGTVLSKNGGPATGGHVSNSRGNAVVLVQRQHLQSASVEAPPDSVVETSKKGPLKGPPPVPSRLIEELKHSATGVEALGVLIQHLVFDLDAFSTPVLKKQVEEYKAEAINTKLSLDEAVASCKRYGEAAELSEVKHREHVEQLIKKHGETLSEVEARLNAQVEETQCRYEEELKRRDRLNARDKDTLLEDVKLYAERAEKAEKRAEGAEKKAEHLDKEREDLVASENDLKQLCCRLQSEIAELQEKLRKDNVTRSGDCGKHRDEIQSLQAVLDLRTKELHDHRKKTEEYKLKTDALNSALARNAALQARVEDLEAQLQRKVANERKLQEEMRSLSETAERESRQSEQLALENEVLEWKINESSKLMASFSGQSDMSSSMTGSMMASSSPCSDRRSVSTIAISLGSPESPPDFMYRRYSPRLSPKSPYSDVMGTIELDEDEEEEEEEEEDEEEEEEIKVVEDEEDKLSIEPNLITPKVRTLVEKNESISWLVEMEEVIPAASFSSHVQNVTLRRSHHGSPLNLLPQMMPELPGPNSPSSSPPTSDPGSSLFRDKGGPHMSRKGAMPPVKKTRPERGKGGAIMYTSTPSHLTMHSHHRHVHHGHYHRHHQPRSTTRLPPSDSPLGSARSRSVSTDSESLDADEASAVANARIAELKAWRGGKSFSSSVDRVPHVVEGTSESNRQPLEGKDCEIGEGEKSSSIVKEGWGVSGEGGFAVQFMSDDDGREDCRTNGPFSTPLVDASKRSGSPYCEFSDEFSNQSPFHGKFEVNGTSLNPMEDSSSSVELVLEASEKQPSPPLPLPSPSTKQPAFHPPVKQGITMLEPSSMLHQTHQLHFQPRHVLSSLCAHPHLSIKESAGEAMISEEISDDTQGESEDEDAKPSDSEDEDVRAEGNGEVHEEADGATPSAEPSRPVVEGNEPKEPKEEELATNNTLKLGQQLLSSSTPDSSHFAHTDSSVMDLSWSEDLELLPSESEV